MKKIYRITLFLLIAISIVSCGSDDDSSSSTSGVLRIGDSEYSLRAGVIEDFGTFDGDLYNFDITLVSSNISTVDGELTTDETLVNFIYFELFTSTELDLEVGVYNLVDNFGDIADKTFVYAEVAENFNSTLDEENGTFAELTSGSINVISNGPTYEFEFNGEDTQGRVISGTYRGSLSGF